MDDNAHLKGGQHIQYIDSRHLYLNHMDPLESVVTIFNRRLADKEHGDSLALGATLCMWHDRAVGREDDATAGLATDRCPASTGVDETPEMGTVLHGQVSLLDYPGWKH